MSKNRFIFESTMEPQVLSKSKAKELKSLSSKKERDTRHLFFVEGEKCVNDMIGAFDLKYLICTRDWLNQNPDMEKSFKERILLSDKRGIEIISSMSSLPDVIAVMQLPSRDENIPKLKDTGFYLLLDEIQDPGNLGTIIRTCDWFGVYDIFASSNTVDAYSPKVVQASMGSLSRVKIHYLNLKELIEKNRNLPLIGTLLNGVPLSEFQHKGSGMILMGNEGRGISEKLKEMVDFPLTIPPVNPLYHPDSLNVSIATAIVLSHLI